MCGCDDSIARLCGCDDSIAHWDESVGRRACRSNQFNDDEFDGDFDDVVTRKKAEEYAGIGTVRKTAWAGSIGYWVIGELPLKFR
mmetsp:Transcript_26288/g.56445  ORF Transcript_26288/g.56445 Transcript_26288/m.56445 type:complete len:85 (-) Transcript_26288:111-365(-)